MDLRHVLTQRLRLDPVTAADAEELYPIFSDPAGWWYDPGRRHSEPERSVMWCERAAARWETDGLSYWTVRDRASGEVIGVGGAQRQTTGNWNLNYRIAGPWQRCGLAGELGRAAIAAAAQRDPTVAVIAWVDEHNTPSLGVARRLGLLDRGVGSDPSDGQRRRAFSDRPVHLGDSG